MRFIIFFIFYFSFVVTQGRVLVEDNNTILNRAELLLQNSEIRLADSLLNIVEKKVCYDPDDLKVKYHCLKGTTSFLEKKYEFSLIEFSKALCLMDSLQLWNCDNYMKATFYKSEILKQMGDYQTCEEIINEATIKCAEIFESCEYTKMMYKSLLDIYINTDPLSPIIEQLHNEIQKTAINIYAKKVNTNEVQKIKDEFMYFYNSTADISFVDKSDSLYYLSLYSKVVYLQLIQENEEALRLLQIVKGYLEDGSSYKNDYYVSILGLYAAVANVDSIEKILPEVYSYSNRYGFSLNEYNANVYIGYMLENNGHYNLAKNYYERVDSFLYNNKQLSDWNDKKKNILTKMIYNGVSLSDYKKVVSFCEEYESLFGVAGFNEMYFLYYNKGLSLNHLELYSQSILTLNKLYQEILNKRMEDKPGYVWLYYYLASSYYCNEQYQESINFLLNAIAIYDKLKMSHTDILSHLYNDLGKSYMMLGDYNNALCPLEKSADIQLSTIGYVNEKTQGYINDCKMH